MCPTCGGAIEPDETDVVEAVENVAVGAFEAHTDTEEGMKAVFHTACYPDGDPRFRRLT